MQLKEIRDTNNYDFKEIMMLYLDSFPENERQSEVLIKARIRSGRNQMFGGYEQSKLFTFALIYYFNNPKFCLLDYYAVRKEFRGKGLGKFFLKSLFEALKLKEKKSYIVIEVEDPNYGVNSTERADRIEFYKSLKVAQVKEMRYILPPLSGTESTEMLIMVYPKPDHDIINRIDIVNLVKELYIEKYERDPSDPLLKTTLNLIPNTIEFV